MESSRYQGISNSEADLAKKKGVGLKRMKLEKHLSFVCSALSAEDCCYYRNSCCGHSLTFKLQLK